MADTRYFTSELQPSGCLIRIDEPNLMGGVVGEILQMELSDIIREHTPKTIVIDFAKVKSMSSSVISALLNVRKEADDRNVGLVFCRVPDLIRDVFRTLNLEGTRFDIVDDLSQAWQTNTPQRRNEDDIEIYED